MRSETAEDTAPRSGLRPREVALIVVFWTFLAILISANRLTDPRASDRQIVPASGPILLTLFEAYLWAALTPLIFKLASRSGLSRRGLLWRLPLLLGIGVALALLVTMATTVVRVEVLDLSRRPRSGPVSYVERFLFLNDFIIYLGVLSAGFAREYFRRYEARHREAVLLQAEAAALRAQLAEAQLAALRMQLNPHFLFNTLHAISALVDRDPAGVRRMIARLSDLLRSTLDDGAAPVRTLEQELEFLSRYLEIMQVRFQGKLEVAVDVDPEARDALVPTLILQPLVENAVKHGVTSRRGAARIEVRARREGGRVVLTVRDTGPGPPPGAGGETASGVGLRNTEARLRQMYGEADALSLRAAEGGGAVAEIRIPYRRAPREDEGSAPAGGSGRE